MSYSVNWTTKVVTVPLADLTLISGSNYSLDVADFWIEMRRLEASPGDGLWAEQAIEYINTQVLSGITYSAIVKLVNGYTWKTDTTDKNIFLIGFNSNLLDTFIPGNGISVLANNSAGKISAEAGSGGATPQEIWEYDLSAFATAQESMLAIRSAAEGAETQATLAVSWALSADQYAQLANTNAIAATAQALNATNTAQASKDAIDNYAALATPLLTTVWKAHFNKRDWNKVTKILTLYDDDKSTPLQIFDTNADMSEITPQ